MWSKSHECCVVCGKTDRKHYGKGVCARCYMKKYQQENQACADRKRRWHQENKERMNLLCKLRREEKQFDSKRDAVLARDGHQCGECGSKDDLVVHHRDRNGRGSDEPNNEIANLQTLCRGCHLKEHSAELRAARTTLAGSGRWSKDHDCCVECGTTEKRHGARGKCATCYARELRQKEH